MMRPEYPISLLLRLTTLATLFSGLAAFGADDPPPYINGSIPGSITAGSGPITLKVVGVNFASDAVVRWNGTPLPSTFVGSWEVAAAVPAALIAAPKDVAITVSTRGLITNTHVFQVVATPVVMSVRIGNTDAALGQDTTMTVEGSGFVPGSTVVFAGTELTTTVQSTNLLTAAVPGRLVEEGGIYPIFVKSPNLPNSNTYSYGLCFGLTSVSPTFVPAGSPGVTISGAGYGFRSTTTAKLLIFGVEHQLATVVSGPRAFTALIPASYLNRPGVGQVSITDTLDGGGSLLLNLRIGDPPAAITAIGPLPFIQGRPGFLMTVIGTRFSPGATVQWNGINLATTFQSITQVFANVPAELLATTGAVRIKVVNPDGGASADFPAEVQENFAITRITPETVLAGSDAFVLTVAGSGFKTGAVILLNGSPVSTSYLSSQSLSTPVQASMLRVPGSMRVAVRNPEGAITQELRLTIESTRPTITRLVPASAIAGSQALSLTVTGEKFSPGATVIWGLFSLNTKFVDSTTLTATVPAAFLATAGEIAIVVANSSGEASSTATFTVRNFVLTSISPNSVAAGSPDIILTVAGGGFTPGSTLTWNSSPLQTAFVNSAELAAIVNASQITSPSTARIAVVDPGGATSGSLTFTIGPPVPTYSAAGIVNAASSGPLIAPGSLISIYGFNLATSASAAASVPLPRTLAGTSVTVNGAQAPLLYVSPLQINAQAPFEIAPGKATIVIESNGLRGTPVEVNFVEAAPGVFAKDDHIVAFSYPDGAMNSPESPASPGQYMTAYLTGQGLVDNAVATGEPAPVDGRLSRPIAKVNVKIGGQPAEVPFIGLAPGFVGVAQINFIVPNVPAGDHPFEVTIGGNTSLPATISVKAAEAKVP